MKDLPRSFREGQVRSWPLQVSRQANSRPLASCAGAEVGLVGRLQSWVERKRCSDEADGRGPSSSNFGRPDAIGQ